MNQLCNIYSSAHRHVEYIQQFPSQDFSVKQNLHFQLHVSDKHKNSKLRKIYFTKENFERVLVEGMLEREKLIDRGKGL